jgi:MATE family multidrug resistance protein
MRRSARQGLWAVAAVTVPTLLLLWHAEALLRIFGQDPTVAAVAAAYISALMWSMPLLGVFIVLRGFLAAMGRPELALYATVLGVVSNVILCKVLVFGTFGAPRLGVMGAGLAGTLANLLMVLALLALIQLERRLRRICLLGQWWRADWARLREVFRVGTPIAGQMWIEIGLFAGAAMLIGWRGAVAVAAHGIAVQIAMLAYRVPLGIGQAATARVGLSIGAHDADGARRAGWTAVALGVAFLTATVLVIIAGAGALSHVFLNTADPMAPAVIANATVLLVIAAMFQLANGIVVIVAGALRGLRDTRVPAILVGIGYWGIGLPVGLVLAFRLDLGASGIWTGLTVGMVLVAVLLLARWYRLAALPAGAAAG